MLQENPRASESLLFDLYRIASAVCLRNRLYSTPTVDVRKYGPGKAESRVISPSFLPCWGGGNSDGGATDSFCWHARTSLVLDSCETHPAGTQQEEVLSLWRPSSGRMHFLGGGELSRKLMRKSRHVLKYPFASEALLRRTATASERVPNNSVDAFPKAAERATTLLRTTP